MKENIKLGNTDMLTYQQAFGGLVIYSWLWSMRGRGGRSTEQISLVKNAGGHNLILKRLEVDEAETLQ